MRSVLLAVFFLVLAAVSITLVVPAVVGLFGDPTDGPLIPWRALASVGVAVALVFGALYAAGLLWLFLACQLFPREEVEQLLKVGPNTRLEIWLLERFSR